MSDWITTAQLKILFNRIANNDIEAFSELYRAFHASLLSIIIVYARNREVADDTVQDIFLKVWERRNELVTIDDPRAWLNTAARYQIKNTLYKEWTKTEFLKKLTAETAGEPIAANDLLLSKQRNELIERTISTLPPQQLKVYRLGREEGLSYEQIAVQLGIGRETVKEHMARALKFLHAALAKQKDLLFIAALLFF